MKRRAFLSVLPPLGAVAAGATPAPRLAPGPARPCVHTVRGPVAPGDLGITLTHEHVLVDFVGADKVSRDRYDADEVFKAALPHLLAARAKGCRTLVECTPAWLGRDPALLKRLSEASRLHLVTNTGYYGAAEHKFVPPPAYSETADQLAAGWTAEFRDGIEGTGVPPGPLKIGVNTCLLSRLVLNLLLAVDRSCPP